MRETKQPGTLVTLVLKIPDDLVTLHNTMWIAIQVVDEDNTSSEMSNVVSALYIRLQTIDMNILIYILLAVLLFINILVLLLVRLHYMRYKKRQNTTPSPE